MNDKLVNISIKLTEAEAIKIAQFLKRLNFYDFRSYAINKDEAYLMKEAVKKLRDAFIQSGQESL